MGLSPDVLKTEKVAVVGVDGCGGNILNGLISLGLMEVKFVLVNTDQPSLKESKANCKIVLKTEQPLTPFEVEQIKRIVRKSQDDLKNVLQGSRIVFFLAGMGGATGTGATPVIARISKDLGATTMAIIVMPFYFEVLKRIELQNKVLENLEEL